MNRTLRSVALLLLAGVVVAACESGPESSAGSPALIAAPPSFLDRPTVEVERGPIEQAVRLDGRVVAEVQAALSFNVPGVLKTVDVKRGDAVRVGDVVAQLDTGDREAQIAAARAELKSAEDRLKSAQAALAAEQAAAERELLLAANRVSARAVELDTLLAGASPAELASARAAVVAAEAGIADRSASAQRIETTLPQAIAAARAQAAARELEAAAAQEERDALRTAQGPGGKRALAAAEESAARVDLALAQARYRLGLLERPEGPPDLQAARASLSVAQAELRLAESALEERGKKADEASLQRARRALQAATIERDAAKTALADLQAAFSGNARDAALLREAANTARARLASLQKPTLDHQLMAPFDGVVTYVVRVPGWEVKPADKILEMADPSVLLVEASVPRAQEDLLAVGQDVEVVIGGLEGQVFKGRLVVLPHEISAPGGGTTRVNEATVAVDWADAGVEIGMRAALKITLEVKQDVLKVPLTAVRTVNYRDFVEALVDGRRRSIRVRTGIRSDDEIEITDGLQEGAVIFQSY